MSNEILCKEQIGFRKASRTADHIFVLKSIIDFYKKKKQAIYACFIDLRRAFDTVWRVGLYYKMLKYGISSKCVDIVRDLYSTHQGCNLSPTLFNLFLNDLPRFLKRKGCHTTSIRGHEIECASLR